MVFIFGMKRLSLLFFALLVSTLIFTTSVGAILAPVNNLANEQNHPIEYNLTYPGLLPDHPLYAIKTLRDRMLEWLTRDNIKKIHLYLLLSDKRLTMGKTLIEKGNNQLGITTFSKGEKYLLLAATTMVTLKSHQDLPPGLSDKLALAARKHDEVIRESLSKITNDNEKNSLNEALSINHQASAQMASVK